MFLRKHREFMYARVIPGTGDPSPTTTQSMCLSPEGTWQTENKMQRKEEIDRTPSQVPAIFIIQDQAILADAYEFSFHMLELRVRRK